MTTIVLQIVGAAFILALIFFTAFMTAKNLRIRKKYKSSNVPDLSEYEKILSRSFQKSFNKDYAGAIEEINNALKLKPHMERLYFQRAKIKEDMKDYQGAKADYTKAILLKSDYDLAYLNRGLLKIKLKDYHSARKDLNKALELNENLTEAQFFKHEAEIKVRKINESSSFNKKYNDINSPDLPGNLNSSV